MPDKYGLLGWPVAHSVSPQMQSAGFAALGIDATYELIPVHPADLAAKVTALRAAGFRGWNVTIPHKGGIIPFLDVVEDAARRAGSVNTVCNVDGVLHGYSTDGYGLARAIEESFGVGLAGSRFVFWGTGGAARATAAYFAGRDVAGLTLVNRTTAKAEALRDTLADICPACPVTVRQPTDPDALRRDLAAADVVIQCTSVGLHPGDPCAIPAQLLRVCRRTLDMIYRRTPLLAAAAELGIPAVDGRGMLLHQGVRSLTLWTRRAPPTAPMRTALDRVLETGR